MDEPETNESGHVKLGLFLWQFATWQAPTLLDFKAFARASTGMLVNGSVVLVTLAVIRTEMPPRGV